MLYSWPKGECPENLYTIRCSTSMIYTHLIVRIYKLKIFIVEVNIYSIKEFLQRDLNIGFVNKTLSRAHLQYICNLYKHIFVSDDLNHIFKQARNDFKYFIYNRSTQGEIFHSKLLCHKIRG